MPSERPENSAFIAAIEEERRRMEETNALLREVGLPSNPLVRPVVSPTEQGRATVVAQYADPIAQPCEQLGAIDIQRAQGRGEEYVRHLNALMEAERDVTQINRALRGANAVALDESLHQQSLRSGLAYGLSGTVVMRDFYLNSLSGPIATNLDEPNQIRPFPEGRLDYNQERPALLRRQIQVVNTSNNQLFDNFIYAVNELMEEARRYKIKNWRIDYLSAADGGTMSIELRGVQRGPYPRP